ncbi:glutamine amidotransferase [Curtobacterium sp. MCBD17_003]|uniref:type 1 glutamine amidotransferase n=1 Tax=Curtobacterium sp. MCBD17_003 TaxID=2175667 RepID=UPI000DA9CDA4|nr:glutamine amidotransferase [Curtobacterium sp. MCBD17_003]WIE55990.1 glutamine amidotransferase [Curtobacterium sp. MCBD17_003]
MTADRLTILHLYPRQMGVSGDRGNVTALVARADAAGIPTEVVRHDVGDSLPTDADVVVVGNGPLSAMRSLGGDPARLAPFLQDAVAAGVPLVAVGGGYDLATREVVPTEGKPVTGLGVFDARAVRGAERRVNYFLLDVRATLPGGDQRVAGFEDHATRIENIDPTAVFADVVSGGGNQDGTGTDGSATAAAFGTHTQGPLLPLNPHLTDAVLAAATGRLGREYAPDPARTAAVDRYAREARAVITRYVDKAFKRIA